MKTGSVEMPERGSWFNVPPILSPLTLHLGQLIKHRCELNNRKPLRGISRFAKNQGKPGSRL
jgi:hypothetical protein